MSRSTGRTFGRVFSDEYVNKDAVVDNFLLLLMYRFAYPVAVVLVKLKISPNQITSLSLLFSIMTFGALALGLSWIWCSIFWGLTVLMDFCDGTVARMTSKISTWAFRYDHMSDLLKLSLVILGTGIRYDDRLIWVFSISTVFFILYADLLNHQFNVATTKSQENNTENNKPLSNTRLRERFRLVAWVTESNILFGLYKNLYAAILTVNGHTLLLFFVLPFGPKFAIWGFCYLIFVEILAIRFRIASLIAIQR